MYTSQIYSLNYQEVLEYAISNFIKEFGERKFNRIISKINSSSKVSNYLINLKLNNKAPGQNDILYLLNEIPFFIFSRGQTIVIGALYILEKWNEEVNKQYSIMTVENLRVRAVYFITETKDTFF